MTNDHSFSKNVAQFKDEVSRLQECTEREIIEQTATRLEGLNYSPALIIPVYDFLRLTSDTLLEEIDKKDKLLRPGLKIVDLGAAPGGWCQYARTRLGRKSCLIAVDLLPMVF